MDLRVLLLAALAVTALAGIALAAEGQVETFLHPKHLAAGFSSNDTVQGNLVGITGLLVAFGATWGAMLTSRVGWRRRLLPMFVMFVSAYGAVLILQTAMFSYVAEDLSRSATFSISPLIMNGDATPSTFLGPLALLVLAALGMQRAHRVLQGGGPTPMAERYGAWLAAVMLATPFLLIAALGNVRVLLSMPADQTGALPYLFLLPMLGLASIAALVVYQVKTWHLVQALREPRLDVVADEAWRGLRRIEWALAAIIAVLSLLATLFEAIPNPTVEAMAFNLNTRTHAQAQIVLLFVLMPLIGMHRGILRGLEERGDEAEPMHRMGGLVATWIIGALAFAAAAILTFTTQGALWPWLGITLPLGVLALIVLPPRAMFLPAALASIVMWGIGNTVVGAFQLLDQARLVFDTSPGMLAMWRATAVTLVAIAVARSARGAPGLPRVAAWPLTAGLGTALAIILFFQFPFSAWIVFEDGAEYVGIGTVVASQDAAVRGVMHGLSALGAAFAAIGAARLHRPEWFRRRDAATPVAVAE